MDSPSDLIAALERLRTRVEHAPSHDQLYDECDGILRGLARYRTDGGVMTAPLAREMLVTSELLLRENMAGRRPWTDGWETYFSKCMEYAARFLREYTSFKSVSTSCPLGYCNQFLDAFAHMDRHDKECEERYPRWSKHFANLAALAAEMFSLVADSAARVETDFLDHSDDRVFTWLLNGYAQSEAPTADAVLTECLTDDEAWVRRLAESLMQKRATAQQPAAADGEDAAAEPWR
jgi:hypothetical protein